MLIYLFFGCDECDVKVNYDIYFFYVCIIVILWFYEDECNI